MKKNLGKHNVWMAKRHWNMMREIWEIEGKLYIRFEHKTHEVHTEIDCGKETYVANI